MDRVNWVVHECFHAAVRLRALPPGDTPMPASLHASARRRVEGLLARAAEAGYGSEDARLMAYAVVALIDEVAMAHDGPLRALWAIEPLQRVYFDESIAGERFFEHLARVLADPARVDVLRVFHLALALGFQGRYRVHDDGRALSSLRARVDAQIAARLARPASLSPDLYGASVPRSPGFAAARWLAVSALLLVLVIALGMRVSLAQAAEELRADFIEVSRQRARTGGP
ncbi:MAG: DotU/TssL family secretion system protein [Polyangiales bacterium]